MNEQRDYVRLRTIALIEHVSQKDENLQNALTHTLSNDANPGIRLKAIKVLKGLPVNDSIKNILISTFFKDTNSGIRKEAADALNDMDDPDIDSILKQKAKNDEYTQSLVSRREAELKSNKKL